MTTKRREMLTTADIAELLQVSTAWVREQCDSGEIPAYKLGREWRVDANEFDAWRERKRHLPHPIDPIERDGSGRGSKAQKLGVGSLEHIRRERASR